MRQRFDENGRMYIPLSWHKKDNPIDDERFVVTEAYCPNGHSLIDPLHEINGFPGIQLAYRDSERNGLFVVSAIEGDFTKVLLSGFLQSGRKLELLCPFCGTGLPVLMACECGEGGELVALGLTPKFDFNNAVAFCNVVGCESGTFLKSGEIIKHVRLLGN
jgi:hypothetical protein